MPALLVIIGLVLLVFGVINLTNTVIREAEVLIPGFSSEEQGSVWAGSPFSQLAWSTYFSWAKNSRVYVNVYSARALQVWIAESNATYNAFLEQSAPHPYLMYQVGNNVTFIVDKDRLAEHLGNINSAALGVVVGKDIGYIRADFVVRIRTMALVPVTETHYNLNAIAAAILGALFVVGSAILYLRSRGRTQGPPSPEIER